MKKLCLLLMLLHVLIATAQMPQPGMKAPEILISKWIFGTDSTQEIRKYELKKPIVLDFFATWCGPCMASLPHLNQLASKFRNAVLFIALTDEKEELIRNRFRNVDMSYNIVFDLFGKTYFNYGVRFIPRTFLINTDGLIVWEGSPAELHEEMIDKVIRGMPIKDIYKVSDSLGKVDLEDMNRSMLEVSNAKNIYSLEIREADSSGQFLQQDDEYLNFRASLKDFIFYATGQASLQRIIFSGNIKSPFLWVNFSSAGSTQSRNRSEVLNALMKIYNFEISKTSQVKDVYEIQATRNLHLWPNDRISEPATLKKITVGRDLTFAGDNQEVKAIANFLESRYNVIVIDSTNITGEFDWEIPDTPFDKLNDLLMKDYGLQLITGSKPIEITVVNFKN